MEEPHMHTLVSVSLCHLYSFQVCFLCLPSACLPAFCLCCDTHSTHSACFVPLVGPSSTFTILHLHGLLVPALLCLCLSHPTTTPYSPSFSISPSPLFTHCLYTLLSPHFAHHFELRYPVLPTFPMQCSHTLIPLSPRILFSLTTLSLSHTPHTHFVCLCGNSFGSGDPLPPASCSHLCHCIYLGVEQTDVLPACLPATLVSFPSLRRQGWRAWWWCMWVGGTVGGGTFGGTDIAFTPLLPASWPAQSRCSGVCVAAPSLPGKTAGSFPHHTLPPVPCIPATMPGAGENERQA